MKSERTMKSSLRPPVWLAAVALSIGCDVPSTTMLVRGVIPSPEPCQFLPNSNTFIDLTAMDVSTQTNHYLAVSVENQMAPEPTSLGPSPADLAPSINSARPLRFDYRWECESTGFTNRGALFLPAFSIDVPFCLDERDEQANFVGFDAVAARGASIPAGGRDIVFAEVVPYELGQAFDDLFILASNIDACCIDQPRGCRDAANLSRATNTNCQKVETLFGGFDDRLSLNNPADLERFQRFAVYNSLEVAARTGDTPVLSDAFLSLRIRGQFEFLSATGGLMRSNDLTHMVGLCRGCQLGADSTCTFDGTKRPL